MGPEVPERSTGPIPLVSEVVQNNEVHETILLAKALGSKNMDRFEDSMAKVVNEEGSQLVDQ